MEIIFLIALILLFYLFYLVGGTFDREPQRKSRIISPAEREMRRVYIMRGRTKMTNVKIGYSSRLNDLRKNELQKKANIELEMIAEVACNYAWDLEQEIHNTLKRFPIIHTYNHRNRNGNEWYIIPIRGQPSVIILIEEIAASLAHRFPDFKFTIILHSKALERWMPTARLRRANIEFEKTGLTYFEIENPQAKKSKIIHKSTD